MRLNFTNKTTESCTDACGCGCGEKRVQVPGVPAVREVFRACVPGFLAFEGRVIAGQYQQTFHRLTYLS